MPKTVMLGVAIGIPEPHATVLTNWRRRIGDPAADLSAPHITLLPPTPVPVTAMGEIEKHLAQTAAAADAYVMHLGGTGTFRPASPVVFIQITRGASDCELLEKAIRQGPLERDLDYPYHPHVTVAHDLDDRRMDAAYEGLADFVAGFSVERFGLFSRDPDRRWRWRTEFELGGCAASRG
jgi:2'-5' RNA ligase